MTQNIPAFDVAIIGSGIAGSALACALNNTDLKVVVIEGGTLPDQAPTCDSRLDAFDPRVSALTRASESFLEQLGIWPRISALRSQMFDSMYVWDGEGTGNIQFDAREIHQSHLGTLVENRVIVYSLVEELQMSPNVKFLQGVKVRGIVSQTVGGDKHPTHVIELDQDRQVKAGLVVGADGANSFVRQTMDFKTREWDYGHHGLVCTIQTEKPHQNTAWQRFMHTGPCALLPLPDGENGEHFCSIVWSASVEEANRLMALDDQEFCDTLTSATESCLGNVVGASRRFSFPLRQRHALDYVQDGIALVADAAHTIHPLAGQGINLGLQDVRVLAEELLRAHRSGHRIGDLRVLSRYQRRRKGDNLMMMTVMEGFKHLFGQQSLAVSWIRHLGMAGVGQVVPLKRQIMKQAMGVR
ncbi:2-octaprenylphenol hydroxylase [BD1-7 clade bacterium]|uniref:2-octaprenylphenol hydroxylase n=1 Tax=BD1-7 clade bacterium TaxID=2029982 RepID=A0A5S9MTR9_9GAMM|nr:2-octaprenylphenol hydroxylase [BD1-7 clade bacterium]CAA0084521.1 2-octaprenylphenol hydroxylase [BD1-7 clade bacterium]